MTIVKPTAVEQRFFTKAAAVGPSRETQEKREGEIARLAQPIADQLSAEYGEKAGYLLLGAFVAAHDQGETLYFGPWPKLLDALVKNVREGKPAYGEALCAAAERRLVTDAIAQKLVPGDYKPPKG